MRFIILSKYCSSKLATFIAIILCTFTFVLYPSILLPNPPLGSLNPNKVITQNHQDGNLVLAQETITPQINSKSAKKPKSEGNEAIDFFKMAMAALAGLVLFIFGVTRLSEGLEGIGTDRMKNLLGKFTSNRFAGVLTGALATTVLESSSVTIIMVIAMVSAGVLTFVQSLGVVLGSNK
jgi:phosphate:Na+ symporter